MVTGEAMGQTGGIYALVGARKGGLRVGLGGVGPGGVGPGGVGSGRLGRLDVGDRAPA